MGYLVRPRIGEEPPAAIPLNQNACSFILISYPHIDIDDRSSCHSPKKLIFAAVGDQMGHNSENKCNTAPIPTAQGQNRIGRDSKSQRIRASAVRVSSLYDREAVTLKSKECSCLKTNKQISDQKINNKSTCQH